MSTPTIQNFLTKKLFIERDIVTYRSLSRELAIHVNVAKNELATYYNNASTPVTATYLLTGEVPARYDENTRMQVDDAIGEESDDGENVPQTKIVLVGEENLAGVTSQFTRIQTTHVYSLSPSLIRDAGLLCGPTDVVRQVDNSKKGADLAVIVGKVIGAHVQMKSGVKMAPPIASLSRVNLSVVVEQPLKEKSHVNDQDKAKEMETKKKEKDDVFVEKAKSTGKLDFSRAKVKDVKKTETKAEQKDKVAETSAAAAKSRQETEKKPSKELPKEESKRGTKRKSGRRVLLSDSDDASSVAPSKPPSKTKTGPRVRKGVVLSDDEEIQATRHRGQLTATSEAQSETGPSLRAMMDVDDDEVVRVSRPTSTVQEEEEEAEETDQDIDTDLAPKPKPKPRKKKIVPVGSNGLKKKRLVKSRQTTDDKGYFVTEDYSSYESVDEEEPEPERPSKGKGKNAGAKGKEEATPKSKLVVKEPSGASHKPVPRGGKSTKVTKAEQRSLANFFGPPKMQK